MNSRTESLPRWDLGLQSFKARLQKALYLLFEKDILGMSASIAYYTVLSLTPYLLLFFGFLALIGWQDAPAIHEQMSELLGPAATVVLQSIQDRLQTDRGGFAFGVFGFLTLVISATGVIAQLQAALNSILVRTQTLEASQPPVAVSRHTAVRLWMKTRLYSVLALLFCVFISTVSLILSIFVKLMLPDKGQSLWWLVNFVGSFIVFSTVFYCMFRYLPSVKTATRLFAVKAGILCSVLFHLGKAVIELYFSNTALSSSYGALSSFVVFLLWAFYNGLIILVSACFARAFFDEQL